MERNIEFRRFVEEDSELFIEKDEMRGDLIGNACITKGKVCRVWNFRAKQRLHPFSLHQPTTQLIITLR